MENIHLLGVSIFSIDQQSVVASEWRPPQSSSDLQAYVLGILRQVRSDNRHKRFLFSPSNPIFQAGAKKSWDNSSSLGFLEIAQQLAVAESTSSSRSRIPTGSLVLALATIDQGCVLLAAKIDRSDFLNETSFLLTSGLPSERVIYKACLVESETSAFPTKVRVFDSQSAGYAKYWWSEFLGLLEERDSQQNTTRAFATIDKIVATIAPWKADYYQVRNALIHYFRTQPQFTIQTLLDQVIGNYQPIDESLPLDRIELVRDKIRHLSNTIDFDQQFVIDFSVVRAKVKRVIALTDELDLTLKSDVPDSVIQGVTLQGNKYVQIRSDAGYDNFKRRQIDGQD
jgi:37-kD nucleoid-associated bacterial protein